MRATKEKHRLKSFSELKSGSLSSIKWLRRKFASVEDVKQLHLCLIVTHWNRQHYWIAHGKRLTWIFGAPTIRRTSVSNDWQIKQIPWSRDSTQHKCRCSNTSHWQGNCNTWLSRASFDRRGPPFNGTGSHAYYQYMKWAGFDNRQVVPEDPKANRLAENF